MTTCGECGTVWHGLTECHCAAKGCHQHFGSIDAFDRHRQGPVDTRQCVDPATVLRKDGKPVFRATDRHGRPTWIVERGPGSRFPVAQRESEPSEPPVAGTGSPESSQAASGPRRLASWHPRRCDGCGASVAARTADPAVRVLCTACHPDPLPLYPGEEP